MFGRVARLPSEGIPYLVFAYAGTMGWNAFSSTLVKATGSLIGTVLMTRWVPEASRSRLIGVFAVACGLPLFLTIQFFSDVRAGMTELLPQKAPARLALEELHDRLGAQSRLIVIAQGEDGDANRRFIKELGQRLEAAKLPEVKLIQIGCFEDCQWVRDHVLLLLDDKRFE